MAAGNPGDVDFIGMVRSWRAEHASDATDFEPAFSGNSRLCVCVRKRPISDKERDKSDHDAITCLNPEVWIHAAKTKVDGITKYLDHSSFCFDQAYGETATTDDVYTFSTYPLLSHCCQGTGVRGTVFAYGQTGSGKTFTMNGIQELLCDDLFILLQEDIKTGGCTLANTKIMVSFFEFYGGHAQDLLNDRQRLKLLEDGKNEIVVVGLREVEATDAEHLKSLLEEGHQRRTTHQTEANDTSSRSHAICQIHLKHRTKPNILLGKISLVDLAGSERGADTRLHNSHRRLESAEINTSLLTLKECIRALDQNNQTGRAGRVPYRGSKLTLLLKDCFTSPKALTTMIATVSPGAASADHSLNTLRYADRIKEKRVRKTPQRSVSASLSPRRPVDTTNQQRQPLYRRASSVNIKSSSIQNVTTRVTRASTAKPSTRITRSKSNINGLHHSNSLLTASSAESRLSYKSAPISSNGRVNRASSRSVSATSSADDELDSILNDSFDVDVSRESSFDDEPLIANSYSSEQRHDTMFEPRSVEIVPTRSDSLDLDDGPPLIPSSPSEESLLCDESEGPPISECRSDKSEDPKFSQSSPSPEDILAVLQKQHLRYVEKLQLIIRFWLKHIRSI